MDEVHPFIEDPVASTNIPSNRRAEFNNAFITAESASILGSFKEARDQLEALDKSAKAVPGYWVLLAEIKSRQGASTRHPIQQAIERLPRPCPDTPFSVYCKICLELLQPASIRCLRQDLTTARNAFVNWLRDRVNRKFDCILVSRYVS